MREEPRAEAAFGPHAQAAEDDGFAGLLDRTARLFEREGDSLVARGTSSPFEAKVTASGVVTFSPRAGAPSFVRLRTIDGASASTGGPTLASDRAEVAIARIDDVEERVRNTGDGLEQSWRFPRPPASRPVMRVSFEGMRYAGATASGHHFVDDATGLGVRYGAATWIDAHGARTSVPVTLDGDALVLAVPAEAAAGPYPATLDPVLSAEQGIDQPVPTPSGLVQDARLAPGPNGTFLAAWTDTAYGSLPRDLRAARLGADGKAITAPVTALSDARDVAVAWDGQRWLVATAGATGTRFVRIASDGTVLDATPKTIPGASTSVTVSFDGAKFLVVASHAPSATGSGVIKALRVDGSGAFDASAAITIVTDADDAPPMASCAAAVNGCAVMWRTAGVARITRLSNANAVLDAGGLTLGSTGTLGGLASDGTQWLAAWTNGASTNLSAARLSSAGTLTPLASSIIDVGPYASTPSISAPNVVWDGTSFVATWGEGPWPGTVRTRPIGPTGDPGTVVTLQSASSYDAFAASGGNRLLVWHKTPYTSGFSEGLFSRPFTSALAPIADGGPAVLGVNQQTLASAAYNGSIFLVVWRDNRLTPGPGVYAARLSSTGTPIDAVGTKIQVSFYGPLASDGDGFMMVDGTQVVRFTKSSAVPIDATPIDCAPDDEAPYRRSPSAIAYDGTNYVIAWSSGKTEALTSSDIRAARITASGQVLDPGGFPVTTAYAEQEAPAIASNGKSTLVVWNDYREDFFAGDLYGARLSPGGVVLDPQGIAVAKRPERQGRHHLAPDGDGYIVAWEEQSFSLSYAPQDIFATRVSASGLVDPIPLMIAAQDGATPVIADMQDGATALVAWSSFRSGSDYQQASVKGAWIRRGKLELLDPTPVGLSTTPIVRGYYDYFTRDPLLLPAGPGRVAAFFSTYVATDRAVRVRMRVIGSGSAVGSSCGAATDCQTRYCSDAVCCQERCDGICRKCSSSAGACETVRSDDDPDTCSGEKTCDASGACKKKNGSVCSQASECASGFCVGSFCCNVACEGACEGCAENRGTCTPLPRGSLGTPSCSPNRCSGTSSTCATTCTTDAECADGFGCDRLRKTCTAGASCLDGQRVRDLNGAIQDCAPYTCRSGTCGASCERVADCAFPAVCDETGRCVLAPEVATSGCATAPPRPDSGSLAAGLGLMTVAWAAIGYRRRRSLRGARRGSTPGRRAWHG